MRDYAAISPAFVFFRCLPCFCHPQPLCTTTLTCLLSQPTRRTQSSHSTSTVSLMEVECAAGSTAGVVVREAAHRRAAAADCFLCFVCALQLALLQQFRGRDSPDNYQLPVGGQPSPTYAHAGSAGIRVNSLKNNPPSSINQSINSSRKKKRTFL